MGLVSPQVTAMERFECGPRGVERLAAALMMLGIQQLQEVGFVDDLDVVTGCCHFDGFFHL